MKFGFGVFRSEEKLVVMWTTGLKLGTHITEVN